MTALMWRETPLTSYNKVYRFQTTKSDINNRMRSRKDFKLTTVALDRNLWVYSSTKYTLKEAIKTFRSITEETIHHDEQNNIYYTSSRI